MVKESQAKYLSKRERLRFDAMAGHDTIAGAALSLGLSPSTLYNWRLKIKDRYEFRRGWMNAVLAQTLRGGTLKTLLHKKRKMEPPEDLAEEEEILVES